MRNLRRTALAKAIMGTAVIGIMSAPVLVTAGESEQAHEEYTDSKMRDAWLDGKLEAAYLLNQHLNSFTIDTKVKNGTAYLSGTVESDIDRDLAVEVAKGIKGINSVENNLTVDPDDARANENEEGRKFAQRVDDATTTAAVKSKLMANSNVKGLAIDVDTHYDVVTLSGKVRSSEEKDLAEQLAKNTGDVKDVNNELIVSNN